MWSVAAVSAVLLLMTIATSRVIHQPEVRRPGSFPRIPGPVSGPGDALRLLGIGSLNWYACLAAAPLFLWLSRRFPLSRGRWSSGVVIQLSAIAVLVLATATVQYNITYTDPRLAPPLSMFLKVSLFSGLLPFVTMALFVQALEARSRAYDRELENTRTRSQLAEARLEALTAQLQPHFLFNTLQGISTLIYRDPAGADAMLTSLSELLRDVLRRAEQREVELGEELRVLEHYLDIARWRFGDRIRVDIDAGDEARAALVPFFILQPLVENAISHGIEQRGGAGTIAISAVVSRGALILAVSDRAAPDADRDPSGASARAGVGIGLSNTRARLSELYGTDQQLEFVSGEGISTVTIRLPFRVRESMENDRGAR